MNAFWTGFIVLAVLATVAELVFPARKLRYTEAIPLDVVAFLFYQFVVFPLSVRVSDPLYSYIHLPRALLHVAWPLRLAMFYLAADLGSYWMHRLMHTRHVWRIHRWHHSPQQLYWLAGVRATVPQQILFNLPYIVALPVIVAMPRWIYLAIMIEGVFRNNWMHMNVTWRSNWLERIFVTPRYHQIHHSTDAELHDGNYGSLFSLWDRLFRTYIDPDTHKPKKFGTGEKKMDPIRLMVGV